MNGAYCLNSYKNKRHNNAIAFQTLSTEPMATKI